MSNLENLVSKISRNSEEKVDKIIADAKSQAKNIMDSNIAMGNGQKEKIMAEAKIEAEMMKSQIISGKKLEVRDSQLKAKQDIINKTFNLALERLKQLPPKEFEKFLENYLLNMDISGDEQLVLPKSRAGFDLTSINEKLFKKGKIGKLSILNDGRHIEDGFIIIKDGIENNNTFSSLLTYYREVLESEVLSSLF